MTITPDLIRRYDRPGPRYTSYPTAAEFHDGVDADTYAACLATASEAPDAPLSAYVHLPFCRERCLYCGCNVVITSKLDVVRDYLGLLAAEVRAVAGRLGGRRRLSQLHWGGGTPTYLSPDEMRALHAVFDDAFEIEPDAERAVEIDPRVTTPEHLATLADLGFSRLSMGVQDFTPEVQACIGRVQPYEDTAALVGVARDLGFESLNVDLIYGLPHQHTEAFARTLAQVQALRPERVAVYSYAHMPWLKPHQRRIPEDALPDADEKIRLLLAAYNGFTQAGYLAVGMDHFALPEDELGQALSAGTLWRNFMGYTVRHAPDTVAFGMSAISDVGGAYVQNERKLGRYGQAVRAGALPAERGYALTEDDRIRRHVITSLMCTFRVDVPDVERRFGIEFPAYFAQAREELGPLAADGFVRWDDETIRVDGIGRFFVRNVCMAFDGHVREPGAGVPRFSRTV